jgi:hypothetical protein
MTFICHPELARDLGAAGRLLQPHRLPRRGASLRYASFSMTDKGCHWQEPAPLRSSRVKTSSAGDAAISISLERGLSKARQRPNLREVAASGAKSGDP